MSRSTPEWIGKTDDTPVPPHVRLRVFQRFNGVCRECTLKIVGKRWICDHRVALINGGENRENNLGPIHTACDKTKTAADVALKSIVYHKAAKNAGISLRKGPAMQSRGFEKREPQRTATRPIRRKFRKSPSWRRIEPMTTTIDEIYAAINPLPARLSSKGRREPTLKVEIEANAGFTITTTWKKRDATADWDREYNCFMSDDFNEVLRQAVAFIHDLPSAEQSALHHFMGQLGRLIDAGRADGIEVNFLNPLLETMKRLSENILTHKQATI